MSKLRYRLVVTTDGRPGLLERTLDSFLTRVSPEPAEALIVDDSGDPERLRYLEALCADYNDFSACRWDFVWHSRRQGFCWTVADAWMRATLPGPPWVFWTEDDFEFRRTFGLAELANVLSHEPDLAQMALMRQPVNEAEKAAGGVAALYADRFRLRGAGAMTWLRSRAYFTTNPSLLRRGFMVECPWPEYESECEGRYGIDLLAAGYEFGIWGNGDPWVEHFGERSGEGY